MRNPIIFSKEAISLFSQIISKKKKKGKKKNQRFKQNIVPSRKFFIFSLVFNRSTCIVSFIVKWNLLSSLSRGRSGLSITKKKKLKRFLVDTGATGVEIVKFRWSRDILEWIERGGCRRFEVSHEGHPVVVRRKRYCRKMFLVLFDFSWFLFDRNDGLSTCSHRRRFDPESLREKERERER